ncbi:hypothetical protein [Deinococcus ficus]|uniref:hypothetical protein n=1 Tax=Deinococcus ficus TaxID=317577 RepID=UPI00040D835B|nr:hypothetical protein [Deinococcus ficus]
MNNYARISSEQWDVIQRQRQVAAQTRRPGPFRRLVRRLRRALTKGRSTPALN